MFLEIWLENNFAWVVVICIFALIVSRSLPKILIRQDPTDKWSHLLDASIWNKHTSLPKTTNRFIPNDDFSYPYGIAYILNRFSSRKEEKFIWLNITLNIFELIFIFAVAYFIFGTKAALIFLLLTSISPSILSPWYGLYGVNARNIGAIISTLYLLGIFFIDNGASIIYLIPALVLLIFAAIYFSQFAIQAIILVSIFSSLWLISIYPIIPLILSFTFIDTQFTATKVFCCT